MARTERILTAVVIVAAVAAAGYWLYSRVYGPPAAAPQQAQAQTPGGARGGGGGPIPVEAAKATVDTISQEIAAVGTLQSNESVVVQPEIAGRVARLMFKEGEKIAAGAPLVELDQTILKAELAQARAELTLSEANAARTDTLFRQGTATARARDEAIAKLEADQARIALARAKLEKGTILAPFAGVLGLRNISVGQYVGPGDRIVNLESIDPLKVDFRVPEIFHAALKRGQTLRISVDARPNDSFDGIVYAIDPLVDQNGRAVRLRATVPNPKDMLAPGMFARIILVVGVRENAVLVPETAIVPVQNDVVIYRIEQGKAIATKVRTGLRKPGFVEILEGIAPNTVVVTAGQIRLRDGAPVEIVGSKAGS
ncbi:MAG: efflux RND transporter periplasmic adaptor subunit [Alphaproteobacteria bacterium]|nr:efflux RND transporter periplasmic adaptor subunit [Alphaproteobacteria bacterium]